MFRASALLMSFKGYSTMRKYFLILIMLYPSALISQVIHNVNSTMSEATIQGIINGASSGDTISFAAGTYNLASNGGNPNNASFNLQAGLFYTGPTSGSAAHLVGAGCGTGCAYPLMYFSGTGVNIQYLTFDNGIIFLDDHTTSAVVDNNLFENIDCGTTSSQVTAIFIAGGFNSSDISFNSFSHIGDSCAAVSNDTKGAGGITFFAFHNVTITHNSFDHVHEGMDIPDSGGGGYDGAGSAFTDNSFTNTHRIGLELLGTSTIPNGLEVARNTYSDPLNPWAISFGLSLTAGLNMIVHDNTINGNINSPNAPPYGVEVAGVTTQAYNNTVEGYWESGFAIGNTLGPISITNNNICGPTMFAGGSSSGSTPVVGNANGFISWEASSQGGTFTGNTTSSSLTCAGTPTVANPVYSPSAGTFTSVQSVAVSTTTPSASIVYTNDGTTPTVTALTCTITHGTLYTGAITVSTSQTLNALGCLTGDNASTVIPSAYVINLTVAVPTFSPPAGPYIGTQSVVISSSTSGSSVIYTNDNSTPTVSSGCTITNGTLYTGAVSVASSLTLKAIGCKIGQTASAAAAAAYTITAPSPSTVNNTMNFRMVVN